MMGELTKCKDDRRYPVEDLRTVQPDGGVHVNANPGFSFAGRRPSAVRSRRHGASFGTARAPVPWEIRTLDNSRIRFAKHD